MRKNQITFLLILKKMKVTEDYSYKHEPYLKGKGGGVAVI